MTTVPTPRSENARSTASRGLPTSAAAGPLTAAAASAARNSPNPRPVTVDVGTTAAPANAVPAKRSRTAAITAASSAAKSIFVTATTPRVTAW